MAAYDVWTSLNHLSDLEPHRVPCAAAVYYNDMYVDRQLSQHSADKINGIKLWITNEHEHNALRSRGEIVLDRLLGMVKGSI